MQMEERHRGACIGPPTFRGLGRGGRRHPLCGAPHKRLLQLILLVKVAALLQRSSWEGG